MYALLSLVIWVLAILLSVALLTLLERKLLASMQRRVGPDTVGLLGLLQPIADAIKLVTKQSSSSDNSQRGLFYVGPSYAFVITIMGWSVVISLFVSLGTSSIDSYQWLLLLAILSLTIYATLLLGWAANSSYAFLGSLRSSAALISYELILATSGLLPMLVAQSYSLYDLTVHQTNASYIILMFPVFLLFFISTLAESSRVPFDLVEAESELVSGYYTEHASVPFVLLFLTEYCSILLFATINSILWLGTYSSLNLGIGIVVMLSLVILARGLLPRLRYDQLVTLCWLSLLPLVFVLTILLPSLVLTLT